MADEFEFDTTTRPTIVENDPNIAEESDEYVSDKEGEPATEPATEPQATSAEPTKQEASGETSLVLLFVHVGILAAVSGWVNAVVPDPYMDEVFHIPQAQYYCVQKYSVWNPKITTPPGLYAISDLFITPVGLFTSAFICTPSFLRAINRIFSIITYLILARLLASVHARRGVADDQLALAALALVMFPVAYFYNFLYYTDSGSTLFVLWAYLCARDGRYMWSGIISAISVTFRQTNIVWVCFLLGISLVRILSTDLKVLQPKKSESEDDAKDDEARLYNPLVAEVASIGQVLTSIASLIRLTFKHLPYLLEQLYSFVLTLAGFVAFVIWNDGIALGDRANHVAGLHVPQLFYFASFAAFFAAPAILSMDLVRRAVLGPVTGGFRRLGTLIVTAVGMLFLVDRFTMEHPFLLSDNRHYTFYVWKNIYRRHSLARYALVPAYMGAGWALLQPLTTTLPLLDLLAYLAAVALTLVPSPLLEFRYFILPFLMYMVHVPVPGKGRLVAMCAAYAAVNAWTVYMFLWKGFEWETELGKVQRFMW